MKNEYEKNQKQLDAITAKNMIANKYQSNTSIQECGEEDLNELNDKIDKLDKENRKSKQDHKDLKNKYHDLFTLYNSQSQKMDLIDD